ncbi:MAG: hypothetical protein DCC57_22545 [Chloroflexi bacterium]|nr:MAG: hypothetical protein DCC57_22545 [Chloroflexota bacterium]
MNTRSPAQPAPQPVKGSWEDLLLQAQQLARNYNDQAIPLYRKVVDGLVALPPARRNAANRRLYNLMMAAALDLQGYYNIRDRYDDALAVLAQLRPVIDEDEREMLDGLTVEVLLQAGRSDEAFARLRALAETPEAELGDWGQLVMGYIRAGQPAQAIPVLEKMAQVIDGTPASPERTAEDERSDLSYLAGLRGITLLEMGDIEGGIAAFEDVIKLGGAYADNLHLLYGRLIHQGRYVEAQRYIDLDRARPVRAAFWRGVSQQHMGHTAKARQTFDSVISTDITKSDQASIIEYILAHYYLSDPEADGLEIVLSVLREEPSAPWVIFYLAGIGWALRGDLRAAKSNLQLAVAQRKSIAEGRKLPWQYWFFARDIVPADRHDEIRSYFDDTSTTPGLLI